ncbi:MAG: M20 family metallo-hydrolase [Promethearchaeota archaeon]
MQFPKTKIQEWIDANKSEILETYQSILIIPALSPEFKEGVGEWKKTRRLLEIFKAWGWGDWIEVIEIPDKRAQNGTRPNIVITYNPNNLSLDDGGSVISVAHMDIVPVGDLSQWDHDPFDPVVRDGKLFGRGTEDNGQGLICSLYGLKCIVDLKLTVSHPIKIVLVSDEEVGSRYGIQPLIKQNLFHPNDLVVVPDAGVASGLEIEVAEKKPLRVTITTEGRQGHAARPNDALNTQPIANKLAVLLYDRLHAQYNETDPLFYPPVSTFEPTKRVNNVDNTNTLPGKDVQYWDCRVLPSAPYEEIQNLFLSTAKEVEEESGATISIEFRARNVKVPIITAETSVVQRLKKAIGTMILGEVKLVGIGGGTCATFFREANIPAVVWGHMAHVAHETNEFCLLDNLYTDIGVFVAFFLDLD